MLFGAIDSFAIEAFTEPDQVASSGVWGRMRIWCQGYAMGDISDPYCSLFGSYQGFANLEHFLPTLWRPQFERLSDQDIFNFLDGRLYGCHDNVVLEDDEDDRTSAECSQDWNEFGDFNFLNNWGEQFDRAGKSFVLCTPNGRVRVLHWLKPSNRVIALEARLDEVLGAIRSFLAWFEREAARLSRKLDA
jgi:hypothetical protein